MWGTTLERDREKISMTGEEFKTIMEMVRMIVDGSKDKEDALRKNPLPDIHRIDSELHYAIL